MDKFVIRRPKNSSSPTKREKRRNLKQATIESLKCVVIVEELERAKVVLERSDTSQELKVDTLQHLKRKRPGKEVLIKTQLGKTVHKLCKSKDEEVAAVAKELYKLWKDYLLSKVNRPSLEVRCDTKTQSFRNNARQMLLDALKRPKDGESSGDCNVIKIEGTQKDGDQCEIERPQKRMKTKDDKGECDTIEMLAEYLERDVYQGTQRLINNAYRRTIRKLVFTLRHQHEMRLAVRSSKMSVEEFVKEHLYK